MPNGADVCVVLLDMLSPLRTDLRKEVCLCFACTSLLVIEFTPAYHKLNYQHLNNE